MARITQDDFSAQTDSSENNLIKISAEGQNKVDVPDNGFIADAQMSRDGQNLVLETPSGETLVIEGYFVVEPAPVIESPDGSILTENLVDSFLHSPAQYAQATSMTDESPVGAVEEMSGGATVIRANGASEPITLGTPIYQGDVIETSTDGAVNVVFIDETSMAVSENARLAIDDYQFDPSTESGETNLSVLRGVFVFTSGLIGRDDPDDVLIDTPVGSIGIRGTIIAGKIVPGGDSEITVVEGAIVVKNGAMEKTLSQQFETIKLGGFNDNMQDLGVQNASDVGKTYGSVSDVVPKLFSSINDAAKEEVEAQQAEEEAQEAQPESEPLPDPILDPALETNNINALQYGGVKPPREKKDEFKKYYDKEGSRPLGDYEPQYTETTPDGPTPQSWERPVFEGAKGGSIVGKVWVANVPAGSVTFAFQSGGANTNFYIDPISGTNAAYIRLSNPAGEIAASGPYGASLGDFTVEATLTNGNTFEWTYDDFLTLDAVVNVNSPGGLDNHDVVFAGNMSPEQKIGSFDKDGDNDFVRLTPDGDIVIEDVPGTPIYGNPGNYSSVDGIGDINNDGYADIIGGDSTATSGAGMSQVILGGDIIGGTPPPSIETPTNGTTGDQLGFAVSGVGDFDGDGKSDYVVSAPGASGGAGQVHIKDSNGDVTITGQSVEGLGQNVAGLGDVNGDGLSDILISNNNNEAYVIYGGTGNTNTSVFNADSTAQGFKISGLTELVAGGNVGDINGDGFDDFAISDKVGGDVNTYIVYGKDYSDSGSNFTLTDLEDPTKALKINQKGVGGGEYQVTALGDITHVGNGKYGDGFDDVQVGVVGGPQYVVHGNIGGDNVPYALDGTATDSDGNANVVGASVKGQVLVGDYDDHLRDATYSNVSMKGGGGNNHFSLTNNTFTNIDGGEGMDTIRFGTPFGTLDFTAVDFEQISQIERIHFTQDNATIRLTVENIFNLLKSSDDGSLKIELGETGGTPATIGTLQIDAAVNHTDDPTGVVNALNEEGIGATHLGAFGGYDHYQVGGYDLYIDTGLTTQVV